MSTVATNADGGYVSVRRSSHASDHVDFADARLECVDPTSDPLWDHDAMRHPEAGPFHQSGWASVLRATYKHRVMYVRVAEEGASPTQVPLVEIPSWLTGKRGVSVPFADACDALVFRRSSDAFSRLCELGKSRGWKYLELRGASLVPGDATASTQYYGHELDLTRGVDGPPSNYAPSVRRAIRKAEASDLRVEHSTSIESLRQYYQLHVRTRQRHGVPPQPWKFFFNIQRSLLEKGQGFVILASQKETPIAGAVFIHSSHRAIYKFGASNIAFQSLRPMNLVMAKAIERLISLKIESLSFGRTSKGNEGLRRFKLGWGARETNLSYFCYDLGRNVWRSRPDRTDGRATAIFKRLPAILNRACGAFLYPHLD